MENVWDYVIDGLFVVFLVSIIAGIAASSNSFNALLFGMFAGTAEDNVQAYSNYTWSSNLEDAIQSGATILQKTSTATAQVYPLATYIAVFALFIGAVLGIVVYAMALISEARTPVRAAVPVRAS